MTDDGSDDEWLDDVLMYAPDEARTCHRCGGACVDDGSGWRHVEEWITDHEPELLNR